MARKKVTVDESIPEEVLTPSQHLQRIANHLQPIRMTIMDDKEYALLLPQAVREARGALHALANQLAKTE